MEITVYGLRIIIYSKINTKHLYYIFNISYISIFFTFHITQPVLFVKNCNKLIHCHVTEWCFNTAILSVCAWLIFI